MQGGTSFVELVDLVGSASRRLIDSDVGRYETCNVGVILRPRLPYGLGPLPHDADVIFS